MIVKRPLRILLLNAATVASLLLCVATLGLWPYSYLQREVRVGLLDGRLVLLGIASSPQFANDLWAGQGSRRATGALLGHAATRHGMLGIDRAEGRVQGTSANGHAWGTP